MIWALIGVLILIVVMMSLSSNGQLPWVNKLRRVRAGVAREAEWMAPDEIVQRVIADYMAAMRWQQTQTLTPWARQLSRAPDYLAGEQLERFRSVVESYRTMASPVYVGVLRAVHHAQVRYFSEDGAHCLVIDSQTQRRMATYDYHSRRRVQTQDMGNAALVYRMLYDPAQGRWKIERFIQELPSGWNIHRTSGHIHVVSELPARAGRDD